MCFNELIVVIIIIYIYKGGNIVYIKTYLIQNGPLHCKSQKCPLMLSSIEMLTWKSRFCSRVVLLLKSIYQLNCIYSHSIARIWHARLCPRRWAEICPE